MAEQGIKHKFVALCVLCLYISDFICPSVANINGGAHVHRFIQHDESPLEQLSNDHLSSRQRRDTSATGEEDEKCKTQENNFLHDVKHENRKLEHVFTFANDSNTGLSLTWAGTSGELIVVTTHEVESFFKTYINKSKVYRSEDDGRSFEDISHMFNGSYIKKRNGLQRNPLNPSKVYLVAYSHPHSKLHITSDGGVKFDVVDLPFTLQGELVFHPAEENHILAKADDEKELYLSTDNAFTWRKIADGVHEFKWATEETDPLSSGSTIYIERAEADTKNEDFLHSFFGKAREWTLQKSTDFGQTWADLIAKIYSFGVQGKFLFVSVAATAAKNPERLMKVSANGGKLFYEAQLPTIIKDQFYSILDMTEGLVFLHVDNPGDTGHGTLYTSGGRGIIYSESLQRHLYPNFADVTDFYKVESMRGVYFASQMEADLSIHSMISFDRGAIWDPISKPVNADCIHQKETCNLQLHNAYSISRGVVADEPLSVKSAVGIILAHGHVADSLQNTIPDVFVTRDGGYNWTLALKGPHYYQIADSGGLLVAVPHNKSRLVQTIKFSTDEGHCWHEYNFTDTPIIYTGLLTEPGSKSMTVSIWGFQKEDRKWRTFVIDFKDVIPKQCTGSDYDKWMAHSYHRQKEGGDIQGCLLGKREHFQRLKPDSWCRNGYYHDPEKQTVKCRCTREDYECDYAYYRPDNSDLCVKEPEFTGRNIDVCIRGYEEEIITKGYRKIPGDVCEGGVNLNGEIKNLTQICLEGDKGLVMEMENAKLEIRNLNPTKKRNTLVIGAIVLVCVAVIVLLGIVVGWRYYTIKQRQVSYRYSVLNQGEDNDNEFEQQLDSLRNVYQESEDEEMCKGEMGLKTANGKVKHYHDDSDVEMLD